MKDEKGEEEDPVTNDKGVNVKNENKDDYPKKCDGNRLEDKVDDGDAENFCDSPLHSGWEVRTSRTSGRVYYCAGPPECHSGQDQPSPVQQTVKHCPGCWRNPLLESDVPGLAGCCHHQRQALCCAPSRGSPSLKDSPAVLGVLLRVRSQFVHESIRA